MLISHFILYYQQQPPYTHIHIHMLTVCLSSYALTSTLLFIFPSILHRKHSLKNQALASSISQSSSTQSTTKSKILRISHRGSPRYSTQNTIQAFRKVYHISDCLEMDVCQTMDGVLVVHHDRSLKESCGVDQDVSQVKYQDLPKYQDKIRVDFAVDKWITTNNEKLPKLQSVFQMFQGIPMDIQLKTPTPSAIKSFIQLIHKYQREDHTIIGIRGPQNHQLDVYYKKLTKQQQGSNKKILTFMNDRSVYMLYLAYVVGLLPFIPIRDNSLQIPIYSKEFQDWAVQRGKRNGQSELKIKIGCQMIRAMNFISKPLIWHLKKRGIMTFGWVCNTKQSMQRAQWMGVAGIMSDQPYELDSFVSQHNNRKNQ